MEQLSGVKIHIKDAIYNLEGWFKKRICQLFLIKNGKTVEAEGTGFLLDIYGLKLLVTAGHVIIDGRHNNICVPNIKYEGFTSLEGTWYPSDSNINLGNDVNDFAYLILTQHLQSILIKNGYEFITFDNIDENHLPSSKKIYTAIGCRSNKTYKKGIDYYSTMEILTNFGANENLIKMKKNESKIIMKNNRKLFNVQTSSLVLNGKLNGMSGGPLWYTDLLHIYDKEQPTIMLVGILQEYDSNAIYSCNINRLLQKLRERRHQ